MEQLGTRNLANGLEKLGFTDLETVRYNLEAAELYEEALRRGEAELTAHGALVARTGQHTGRSP
ncbi:Phosphoenolpyruvate carboxykinase (ATP) [compost metagenome]